MAKNWYQNGSQKAATSSNMTTAQNIFLCIRRLYALVRRVGGNFPFPVPGCYTRGG
jgi:hypothetical protein